MYVGGLFYARRTNCNNIGWSDYFRGIGDYHNSCYKCKIREKETKTTALDDIFVYKYQMTGSTLNALDINCQGLTRALNRVIIVFHDDPEVMKALDNLWLAINGKNTKITDDLLITLLRTMSKSAGIKCNDWNDSRFTRVFKV